MNSGYKTEVVEPKQKVAVPDVGQTPDDELAAKALEEIRSTERLSSFGRFVTRLQNFFQASKASHSNEALSHLKLAPIMMSAGALQQLVSGTRYLRTRRYAFGTAVGLGIGGVAGVIVAAYFVKSMQVTVLRWLVAFVALYVALVFLRAAGSAMKKK